MNVFIKMQVALLWIAMVILPQGVMAQERQLRGTVVTEESEPMLGVVVQIDGTNSATTSDIDGNFTLRVPTTGTINLRFTYVGYQGEVLSVVPTQDFVKMTMNSTAVDMDEVVVIGFGSQRKADITGAVASVGADIAEDRVVTSTLDAMRGKISGVRITSTQGGPGASMDINIRGNTSLSGDSKPLYIIDGFPGEASDVSPGDIESIDILKDASSTAIYGSDGANGVVIITTKKGKKGAFNIDFNYTFGVSSASNKYDLLDSYEFAKQKNFQKFVYNKYYDGLYDNLPSGSDLYIDEEGNIWSKGNTQPSILDNYEDFAEPGATNTDWQDLMLSEAIIQDYRVSLRGGGDSNTYSVMLSYLDEEGILMNTNRKVMSGRLNFSQDLGRKAVLSTNTGYTRTISDGYSGNIGSMLTTSPTKEPNYDPYDEDTLLDGETIGKDTSPLSQAQKITNLKKSYTFTTNEKLTINFTDKISASSTFGYRKSGYIQAYYYPSDISQGWDENGRLVRVNQDSQRVYNENLVTYSNEWANVHRFSVVGGMTIDRTWNESITAENWDFELEGLDIGGISNGTVPQIPSYSNTQKSTASFLTRVNYEYDDKYLFKFSLRADGASNLAAGNQWGYFPSAAAGWRIDQESWMESTKDIISNLKLRLSWGISGKNQINAYTTLAKLSTDVYTTDGEDTYLYSWRGNLPNSELKWETTEEYNLGFDVGLFNNKVSISADAYSRTTRDLLYSVATSTYSGFGSQTQNHGSIGNKGVELSISANVINRKDFSWDVDFNISANRSKVIEIGDQSWAIMSSGIGTGSYYLEEGKPLALYLGYETNGIWQSQAEIDAAYSSYQQNVASGIGAQRGDLSEIQYNLTKPGYAKIADQPNTEGKYDGTINSDDRTIVGKGEADFSGGFGTTVRYKAFTLSLGFTYNVGNDIYNQTGRTLSTSFNGSTNQLAATVDRWYPTLYHYDATAENGQGPLYMTGTGSNTYPINTWGQTSESTIYDIYMEDGSFLRLNDITLLYNLPKAIAKKLYMNKCSVFVSVKNAFVITNYSGYDPEVNMSSSEAAYLCPGLDNNAYPQARTFSVGVKLSF